MIRIKLWNVLSDAFWIIQLFLKSFWFYWKKKSKAKVVAKNGNTTLLHD